MKIMYGPLIVSSRVTVVLLFAHLGSLRVIAEETKIDALISDDNMQRFV